MRQTAAVKAHADRVAQALEANPRPVAGFINGYLAIWLRPGDIYCLAAGEVTSSVQVQAREAVEGTRIGVVMLLVRVPRIAMPMYGTACWSELVSAAEMGADEVTSFDTPIVAGQPRIPDVVKDTAVFREGEGRYQGKAWLFQQNW